MLQTLLAPAMVALLLPGELPLDAASLSAKIDTRLAVRQADAKVHVAPVADDAEFFRRVCLDLIGRVPSVAELGDFLDDERPDKRARWANDLLNSPDYAPSRRRTLQDVGESCCCPERARSPMPSHPSSNRG